MNKKELIMKLALELFTTEGYDNVGVQKIVDAAGVKKPTLYHYFKSKNALLEAVLEDKFLVFLSNLSKQSIYKGDIVLSLEKIVFFYFDFVSKNELFYKFLLSIIFLPEESPTYKTGIKYAIQQYQILEKLFLEAEKQHGNLLGKSKMLTYTFLAMLNSSVSYYFVSKNKEILSEENARKICKQFMYGIFS